jgi:hypothetical protein
MNNYVIEGDIDFFAEISGHVSDTDTKNCCLLTGEPLDPNHVTMQCGHKFNYQPLFKEILCQKSRRMAFSHDTLRLGLNEMKCPYCRKITQNLLPYVPLPGCKTQRRGVNAPYAFCMAGKSCEAVIKSGKRKGHACGLPAYEDNLGVRCSVHRTSAKRPRPQVLPKTEPEVLKTEPEVPKTEPEVPKTEPEVPKHSTLHKLNIVQLRSILKTQNRKVGGRKSELIDRIIGDSSSVGM